MTATVIIPTFNYARYIVAAVQSVLDQRHAHTLIEIIIIDDGSTDDTLQVLQPFIESAQVQYHFQRNQGKASAICLGIKLAKGDVIFTLDADDYYLPGKMASSIAVFEAYPAVVHVASPAQVVFEDGRPSYKENIPPDLFEKEIDGQQLLKRFYSSKMLYGGGSTFAGRATALKQVFWDASIDMYADEWLVLESLLKGNSYFLQNAYSVWWVHHNNYSGKIGKGISETTHDRLLQSSSAVLRLLEEGDYPEWLRKRYRFKHEHRIIMWLEAMNKKDMAAIVRFIRKGILSGNKLHVLIKYHAFRRLFPSGLIALFKSK